MNKVRFERDGDVAVITLADPPLNMVSPQMMEELGDALSRAHDSDIRAVLLQAEGDAFCAGANVDSMFKERSARSAHALISEAGRATLHAEQLPVPTICAVQGMCLAGGLEVALAMDII